MTRLAAAVANRRGGIWSVPVMDRVATDADAVRVNLPAVRALSPSMAGEALLYLSAKPGGDSLWQYVDGKAAELWRPEGGAISAPVAVSPDGTRIAVNVREGRALRLYVMSRDGAGIRSLAEGLDVHGSPSWAPDGKSVVISADQGAGGRLFRVPTDGGAPQKLSDDHAYDPIWSPDGNLIVYALSLQTATFPVRAMTPSGQPVPLPELAVRGDTAKLRFVSYGKSLVALLGKFGTQNFYLVDWRSGKMRQLTNFSPGIVIRNFDVTPDGKRIVFDRQQENSDIVLIDLPPRN